MKPHIVTSHLLYSSVACYPLVADEGIGDRGGGW